MLCWRLQAQAHVMFLREEQCERTNKGFGEKPDFVLLASLCSSTLCAASPGFPGMGNQSQPRLQQTLEMEVRGAGVAVKQEQPQQSKGPGEGCPGMSWTQKAKQPVPPFTMLLSPLICSLIGAAPAPLVSHSGLAR